MALNVAKVTFCFQQEAYGWTESYFLPSPSSTLEAELGLAETLASKRAVCSGSETMITHVKVSNENIGRDVLVSERDYLGDQGQHSDAPDTALLVYKYPANNLVRSPLYLRGIWDDVVLEGGQFQFNNPGYNKVFGAFVGLLTSGPWGFIARVPASFKKSPIATMVDDGNGRVIIQTTQAIFAGIGVGQRVKTFVSGATGAASVNGPQVVEGVANNTVVTINRIPFFPYTGGGQISYNEQLFYKISRVYRERVVERKVGRPLFLSVGRRKGRKLA